MNVVKQKAKKEGIPLWKIADAVGISEATMTRMMRRNLSGDKEKEMLEAIESIKQQMDTNGEEAV